jgi:hypothetical protein
MVSAVALTAPNASVPVVSVKESVTKPFVNVTFAAVVDLAITMSSTVLLSRFTALLSRFTA